MTFNRHFGLFLWISRFTHIVGFVFMLFVCFLLDPTI